MKDILKKINISVILDFLMLVMLLIQDIDYLRLFHTQMYKYIIILMLIILIIDFIKNKKKFKLNFFYIGALILIYLYLFIVSFSKTIVVPSIFFVVEIVTFTLYIQSKKDNKELMNSIFNVILYSSVITAIFSVIQFITYKLDIKVIYKFITQNIMYLKEGRFTSFYTEPAHLCTLLCAGLFICMLNLFAGKKKINYLYLVLLMFATILTGSVVVYYSLILFVLLAAFVAIFAKKDSLKIIKKNVIIVAIVSIITAGLTFGLFERDIAYSIVFKFEGLFSDNDYDIKGKKSKDLEKRIKLKQMSNSSPYSLKSNFFIGFDKMRDKYYLGTGMFTHIVYYDEYMLRRYPNGYVRINYADAGSIFLRIFSEFGIVGLVIFTGFIIYLLIKGIKEKDYNLLFVLTVFITLSSRLGEYNWVLNCLSFIMLLGYVKFDKRFYKTISLNKSDNKKFEGNNRILALSGTFLPHNETITQISYKMLCNLDYDIDVVSFRATPDKSFEEYIKKDPKFSKIHIHYIDVDLKALDINSHNFNIFKIKKYMKMYSDKSMELFEENKYNYVFSFSVPNYTHDSAYKIKKKYKDVKWFASFSDPIVNNLYVEEYKHGNIKTKILYCLLKMVMYRNKFQNNTLKYADKLIFISEALRTHVTNNTKEYVDKSIIYPITYVKDWSNYKVLTEKNTTNNGKKIVMSHFGNIYGLRKIDRFLEALDELINEGIIKPSEIEIHQYGDVDKHQIELFNNNDKNILHVYERVDYNKCIELMKKSDVLLIFDTIVDENITQPFLPSKITDYLLASKPIFAVTTKNSPLYDIINKNHICTSYDVEDIKKGLLKQVKNKKSVNNDIKKYDNDYVSRKAFKDLLDTIKEE